MIAIIRLHPLSKVSNKKQVCEKKKRWGKERKTEKGEILDPFDATAAAGLDPS